MLFKKSRICITNFRQYRLAHRTVCLTSIVCVCIIYNFLFVYFAIYFNLYLFIITENITEILLTTYSYHLKDLSLIIRLSMTNYYNFTKNLLPFFPFTFFLLKRNLHPTICFVNDLFLSNLQFLYNTINSVIK